MFQPMFVMHTNVRELFKDVCDEPLWGVFPLGNIVLYSLRDVNITVVSPICFEIHHAQVLSIFICICQCGIVQFTLSWTHCTQLTETVFYFQTFE